MQIAIAREALATLAVDLLAITIFRPTKASGKEYASLSRTDGGHALDQRLNGALSALLEREVIRGDLDTYRLVPTAGQMPARYIALLGAGETDAFSLDTIRRLGATLARAAEQVKAKSVAGVIQPEPLHRFSAAQRTQALVEGLLLGRYRFDHYKAKADQTPRTALAVTLVAMRDRPAIASAIERGEKIAAATNYARDLVNQPANICTPEYLADQARQIARQGHLTCTIFDQKTIVAQRMHLLHAVAQGAPHPPTFIHLRYTPAKKPTARIAIVGKGVTFDTGGFDLKASKSMAHMKEDMAGAGAVLGTMQVIAACRPPMQIDAYCPCTENILDGKAHHAGDIVTARSGKTVELVNMDAEGRLILADAFDYALEQGPDCLIDLATLTAGVPHALGEIYTAVIGNDQPLINQIISAGKTAGERMWQLPLEQEYLKGFTSGPADLRNMGRTMASTISASIFLHQFVGETRWAHLDIAAVAWSDEERPYTPKGGTGAGVRTLCEFLLTK